MIQTIGLKRNSIDKFYTKKSVADICQNYINKYIKFEPNDIIIEPSVGNGSFIDCIKSFPTKNIFFDLEPEHNEIIKQDYLLLEVDKFKIYNKIHIIGNPPFGRQSSLAIKFIKKSCLFCDTISFILPRSFKKQSLQNKFPSNFHLIFEIDLPSNSFLVNNQDYDVPCLFQIWQKSHIDRITPIKLTPKNFTFVKKTDKPDISFRRVGVNAGCISTDTDNKSVQSHYFIKFSNTNNIEHNIVELSSIIYIYSITQ